MLNFEILRLDIAQSYFTGTIRHDASNATYRINVQGQRRDKMLRIPVAQPYRINQQSKVLVRVTGPRGLYVEDWLSYGGQSEWLEIDSDAITYYMADHQDMLDTIEVDFGTYDIMPQTDAKRHAETKAQTYQQQQQQQGTGRRISAAENVS